MDATSLWQWLEMNHSWVLGPFGTIMIHEVTYFGAFLPFLIADFLPPLKKYKIQQNKTNDWNTMWKCFKWLMFLHFCVEAPLVYVSDPLLSMSGTSKTTPLPPWSRIFFQIAIFFIIEDFYFYWIHRFLHWNAIYQYIHKVHHDHAAPFGITAEYAHPIETICLGLGTVLGPILFSVLGSLHHLTLQVWLFVRVLQTVEVHSGYNFPWSLNNWIPFWGGAEFHDYHHMSFTNNYSSTFTVWDSVFKTSDKYKKWKSSFSSSKFN